MPFFVNTTSIIIKGGMMKTSEKTGEIIKAMSVLQSRLTTLSKDTKAYNYKYCTLASIWESFRPHLEELGLFIFQDVVTVQEGVQVATRICHTSDQWIETDYILIPMGKRDAHSTGSAATYGRRYSLTAALGIVADDDDDGNKAMEGSKNNVAPVERIGKEMAQTIRSLIPEDQMDETLQTIYRAFNINKLEDVPKLQFNRVCDGLQKKFKEKTEVKIDGDTVELEP